MDNAAPQLSQRIRDTDTPVIVSTRRFMNARPGALSLAQGIVWWQPPPVALKLATQDMQANECALNAYGPDEGMPALRAALVEKLRKQNGIEGYGVQVTCGANQAFTLVLLSLCDVGDTVVLFRPYYFNFKMSLQMTGSGATVVYGERNPTTLHPDTQWLRAQMASQRPPKLVVIVNPCNPTGVLLELQELQELCEICHAGGAWLVFDNTYEDFVFDGRQHHCVTGPHVLHLFSFSKAYGMMGWRVGYIAYPESAAEGGLDVGAALMKVQDSLAICACQLSQRLALHALDGGQEYVAQHVAGLTANRSALLDALSPLGTLGKGVAGGEGAIYFWARLPPGFEEDDDAAVQWLVREAGVCVVPGSAFGAPGYIRCAFANLSPEAYPEAAQRLKQGLQRFTEEGPSILLSA